MTNVSILNQQVLPMPRIGSGSRDKTSLRIFRIAADQCADPSVLKEIGYGAVAADDAQAGISTTVTPPPQLRCGIQANALTHRTISRAHCVAAYRQARKLKSPHLFPTQV
jgi:hypothetical protein